MTMIYKIFAINPGSTSTKVALFENDRKIFSLNIIHDAQELKKLGEIGNQLPYRKKTILNAVEDAKISLHEVDAFVGRGGPGCVSMEGGTYRVNDLMMAHCRTEFMSKHPSNLGCLLAYDFSRLNETPSFIVNSSTTDEFEDIARISGFADVFRISSLHVLNQKEVAIRCAEEMGNQYEQANFVVVHMGGGITIGAHRNGRIIDCNDGLSGDGPMAPNRSGQVPLLDVIGLCFSGRYTYKEMHDRVTKSGGLVDHLGTADLLEVKELIKQGDPYAALVYEAMIYQIGKAVGSCAVVLHGRVDAIVLTGGLAKDGDLVERLTGMVKFLAPVKVYPGEFELEAMASGVLRVLTGREEAKEYFGIPVWNGFHKG